MYVTRKTACALFIIFLQMLGGEGAADRMGFEDVGPGEPVDMKDAMPSEAITGVDRVVSDEHGLGALPAIPLPSPQAMTADRRQFMILPISLTIRGVLSVQRLANPTLCIYLLMNINEWSRCSRRTTDL